MAEKAVTVDQVKGMIADAIKDLATKEGVVLLIGDATKELVTSGALKTALEGVLTKADLGGDLKELDAARLVTKEELHEALLNLTPPPSAVITGLDFIREPGEPPHGPIPAEYLEGLVFRSSRQKKTEDGTMNVPTERPLRPGDVLSWVDNGDSVSIVTADGQKHTVDKD